MPDVVHQRLDVALDEIESAGFTDDVEVKGGGLLGVLDESKWVVCTQAPAAGRALTSTPEVTVDRSCGDDAASSPTTPAASADPTTPAPSTKASPDSGESTSASGEQSSGPSESIPESTESGAEALTVENSADLAALLLETDYCSSVVQDFATAYKGKVLEFDGNVGSMLNHGDWDTRYDILIGAGDFSETSQPGPAFQFRDVNVFDLNLVGEDIPDTIGVGDNLRITAEVIEYEDSSCLFLLDPVSTQFR